MINSSILKTKDFLFHFLPPWGGYSVLAPLLGTIQSLSIQALVGEKNGALEMIREEVRLNSDDCCCPPQPNIVLGSGRFPRLIEPTVADAL